MPHWTTTLFNAWDTMWRERVYTVRERMFRDIIAMIEAKPDAAAEKFGQSELLEGAELVEKIIDVRSGILYLTVEVRLHGQISRYSYSLYATGDVFRIGLLLYDGLEKAPLVDWHQELDQLWPGSPPDQKDRKGLTLYEWTYLVPDLYSNFLVQERFILGMRHMQGRILRIVSDYFIVRNQEERDNEAMAMAMAIANSQASSEEPATTTDPMS